ncbi:MAG: TMEM175 family protein [Rubrobacteraceae bacterium]
MGDEPDQLPPSEESPSGEARFFYSLDRFSAFSDGVFAIAITLLVLDLPVPPENVPTLVGLLESWPEFIGYLISFAFIGSIWLTHSALSSTMKRGDSVALGLNLLALLFVTGLPFSTQVMVADLDRPDLRVAVLVYGLNFLFASLTLSFLMSYVARNRALLVDDIADETVRRLYRRRWIAIGLNVFALATAIVAPRVAVGLYVVTTALLLGLPLVALRRRWRRSRAA